LAFVAQWPGGYWGTGGGDTTISLRQRGQRALVPTISQAWSPDIRLASARFHLQKIGISRALSLEPMQISVNLFES